MKVFRVILGIVLVLAGCAFFLYPNFRDWNTQSDVDAIEEEFQSYQEGDVSGEEETEKVLQPQELQEKKQTGDVVNTGVNTSVYPELYQEFQEYNQSLIEDGQVIMDAWSYNTSHDQYEELEDGELGYIEIPDMKVRLPLYIGSTSNHLAKGAAIVNGTSMPIGGENTNCAIAAHRGWRGSAYFQYVENMKVGSKVYITTPWETLTYQAVETKIVLPSDVESVMIQEGRDMITLVTCHPYQLGGGPYRYLVYCVRTTGDETQEELQQEAPELEGKQMGDVLVPLQSEEIQTDPQQDELLVWETRLRTWLPSITLVLCGGILFVRTVLPHRNKKKDN